MRKLAIVILNFNGKSHLETFLPSVIDHSDDHPVIVVDNASTDASIDWLSLHFPQVECIQLSRNWGFAQGYNEGLSQLNGQYEHYLLLNSDVKVSPNYLKPMLERLENPKIGAVQPKILSYHQPAYFEHAGACGGFLDRNGFPFCRGRIFTECEEDRGQYDEPMPVFWGSGACLMIKSKLFHQHGGFDPSFFAHMEEIDLCWRLQHAGYEIWVTPESQVFHVGGGTLSYDSPKKTFLNFRNNLFMMVKNQRGFWPGRLFIRMLWDGIAAWQFLLRGKAVLFFQVGKAHGCLYLALFRLIQQRKKPAGEPVKGRYSGNVVLDFYWKKKKHYSDLQL